MGRPGNKRLRRAMYGASPSSANGSTTTEGSVTRVTGSVINNGGNMRSGLYPRIGMGLAFLRKTRVTENCCFVGRDEDLKTQLYLATAYASAFDNTQQVSKVTAAATALQAADSAADSATTAAAISSTAAIKATKLADYNAKNAVLVAMDAKNAAAIAYVANQTANNLATWLAA
jgi:hypothetical protein